MVRLLWDLKIKNNSSETACKQPPCSMHETCWKKYTWWSHHVWNVYWISTFLNVVWCYAETSEEYGTCPLICIEMMQDDCKYIALCSVKELTWYTMLHHLDDVILCENLAYLVCSLDPWKIRGSLLSWLTHEIPYFCL